MKKIFIYLTIAALLISIAVCINKKTDTENAETAESSQISTDESKHYTNEEVSAVVENSQIPEEEGGQNTNETPSDVLENSVNAENKTPDTDKTADNTSEAENDLETDSPIGDGQQLPEMPIE